MAESKFEQQNMEPKQLTVDTELEETVNETIKETPEMSPTFDFNEKSWKTDFTLVVEGTKFHVAKLVLALASPVFERMFESDFNKKTCDELELAGKRAKDVNEFLLAVYPSAAAVSNLSKEKALKILPLAEEYQVLSLKQKCEDALLGSTDTVTQIDELYRLIVLAHTYDLKTLLAKCVNFVSDQSPEDIKRENRNNKLPIEPLRDIFENVLERLKELELSDMQKAKELETCKTLINVLSRTLKKANVPKLDKDLDWMGTTLLFTIDVIKKKAVTETVAIWETELQVKLHCKMISEGHVEEVSAFITNATNKIECPLKVQSVVLNKFSTKEHLLYMHETAFSSKQQSVEFNVASLPWIANPHNGYVFEGNVQIELNIMMSKPKRLD